MTCNYCGFENAENALKCIKCGVVLENQSFKVKAYPSAPGSIGKTIGDKDVPSPIEKQELVFGKTISDTGHLADADLQEQSDIYKDILQPCEKCGFPNPGDAVICANCKSPVVREDANKYNEQEAKIIDIKPLDTIPVPPPSIIKQNFKGTIDPYKEKKEEKVQPKSFSFIPVTRENEKSGTQTIIPGKKFGFEEGPVVLNRANLDENNYTITSKVQAEVFFTNKKWHVVDKSEFKTTFVQACNPVELKDGDIVLMGDRKFIFMTDIEASETSDDFERTQY